jgi:hypothetical protein
MPRLLPGLALLLLAPAPALADAPPVSERGPGLRGLAIRAAAAAVAAPADPVNPTEFVVRELLRGKGVRPGQRLSPGGLAAYQVRSEDPPAPLHKEPRPRRVALALLFLGDQGELLPGGFRFCTEDGRVLAPRPAAQAGQALRRPGRYDLVVAEGVEWDALLRQARADLAQVERVHALRRLARPERRNQALLGWVARHRGDFGIPADSDSSWAQLHDEVFRWVLDSGRIEDCWAALGLYAELNRGGLWPRGLPPFGGRAGRAFLLGKALDEKALLGERARAVALLGEPEVLVPPGGRAEPLGEKERDQILERLTALVPLEPLRPDAIRVPLARTLRRLSRPDEVGLRLPPTKAALAALADAYKSAAPGAARDELAEAVCALAEPARWKALSGNPPGLVACLRDLSQERGQLQFWVSLRPGGGKAYEQPTLVLEKLGLLNVVSERKKQPLPVVNFPGPWSEGWDGADYLLVQAPLQGLSAGTWRVRVEGTVGKGKGKAAWTSEPRKIVITQPKGPRRGYPRRYKY